MDGCKENKNMKKQMDGWMDKKKQMDGWLDGQKQNIWIKNGLLDGQKKWMDKKMDGQMHGQKKQMDGQK